MHRVGAHYLATNPGQLSNFVCFQSTNPMKFYCLRLLLVNSEILAVSPARQSARKSCNARVQQMIRDQKRATKISLRAASSFNIFSKLPQFYQKISRFDCE